MFIIIVTLSHWKCPGGGRSLEKRGPGEFFVGRAYWEGFIYEMLSFSGMLQRRPAVPVCLAWAA